MIKARTKEEIAIMTEGGRKLKKILDTLLESVNVGTTGADLDRLAFERIEQEGGKASFTMVPGYKWATCICTNDSIVHGIPDDVPFKTGDIVGVDVGLYYEGFHTDASWSVIVGKGSKEDVRFLHVGEKALYKGIKEARSGNRVGNISQAIQKEVEAGGYAIVKMLVGHGVGKKLHEEPEIPGFLSRPMEDTPELREGYTLAIEVIYSQGSGDVRYDRDGWTIRTKDGRNSGLFEKTIALSGKDAIILT